MHTHDMVEIYRVQTFFVGAGVRGEEEEVGEIREKENDSFSFLGYTIKTVFLCLSLMIFVCYLR